MAQDGTTWTLSGTQETAPASPGIPRLVGEEECISILFAPDVAPAPRTWRKWKKRRIVPYVKLGSMTYYDPEAVRAALLAFTVTPRR